MGSGHLCSWRVYSDMHFYAVVVLVTCLSDVLSCSSSIAELSSTFLSRTSLAPSRTPSLSGVPIGRDQGRAPGRGGRRQRRPLHPVGGQRGGLPHCALHPAGLLLQRGPRKRGGLYQSLHDAGKREEKMAGRGGSASRGEEESEVIGKGETSLRTWAGSERVRLVSTCWCRGTEVYVYVYV